MQMVKMVIPLVPMVQITIGTNGTNGTIGRTTNTRSVRNVAMCTLVNFTLVHYPKMYSVTQPSSSECDFSVNHYIQQYYIFTSCNDKRKKRYMKAMIRKRRSKKEIPTPDTEVGKKKLDN